MIFFCNIIVAALLCMFAVCNWVLLSCAAEYSPFSGIEKGAVLQEARVFNDPQLDSRRCSQVLFYFNLLVLHSFFRFILLHEHDPTGLFICWQVITKLLYLLNQGDTFTKVRSCSVFCSERQHTTFTQIHMVLR